MTDRINALTVVLVNDLRNDDAQPIINAIKLLYGVVSVDSHVADVGHHIARAQVKGEIKDKVLTLYREI